MTFTDFLVGRPLATSEERAEQIGTSAGIPIFGLDALSSAAYGPEAALTLLIPLGLVGSQYIFPLIISILILLVIVFSPTDKRLQPTLAAVVRIQSPVKTLARSPDFSQRRP